MTGNNLNKFMRSNIQLKPWMLARNTNQIVSNCIEKIYKQTSVTGNDASKGRISNPKPENKGPVRELKLAERMKPQATISRTVRNNQRTTNLTSENLLSSIMHNTNDKNGAVASVLSNKKILNNKSVNYKIYNSRRFGSSVSSSTGSVFRGERRRSRMNQALQTNYLLRSFGTVKTADLATSLRPVVASFLPKIRNQHLESNLGSVPKAVQLSSVIQADLMDIDSKLKQRIAVTRKKLAQIAANTARPSEQLGIWNAMPPTRMNMPRENERWIANNGLLAQERKLRQATKKRSETQWRNVESARLSSHASLRKESQSRGSTIFREKLPRRRDRTRDNSYKHETASSYRSSMKPAPRPVKTKWSQEKLTAIKRDLDGLSKNPNTKYLQLMLQATNRRIENLPQPASTTSYQMQVMLQKQAEQQAQLHKKPDSLVEEISAPEKEFRPQAEQPIEPEVMMDVDESEDTFDFGIIHNARRQSDERYRQNALSTLQKETVANIHNQIKETEKILQAQSKKPKNVLQPILEHIQSAFEKVKPVQSKNSQQKTNKQQEYQKPAYRETKQHSQKSQYNIEKSVQAKLQKAATAVHAGMQMMQLRQSKQTNQEVRKSLAQTWAAKIGATAKPMGETTTPMKSSQAPPTSSTTIASQPRTKKVEATPRADTKFIPPSYTATPASQSAAASVAAAIVKPAGPYASRHNRRMYLTALGKF